MEELVELRLLSNDFYKDYPGDKYPELESKNGRPYVVLLVRINDLKFAIPFRTNIKHKYSYTFKSTGRTTKSNTGIDFSKAIVVLKESYLDGKANIDNKEYAELDSKASFIINKFKKYVQNYVTYKTSGGDENIFYKYRYSTLNYFDEVILKDTTNE